MLINIISSEANSGGVFDMATRSKKPSEYGGTPGRIQGEMTSADEARLMRATDSLDPADNASGALARELAMEKRSGDNLIRGEN